MISDLPMVSENLHICAAVGADSASLQRSEHQKLVDNAADDHAKRALEKTMTQWDKDFIDVDQNVLYFVTLAANYLNIKDLL